MKKHAFSRYYDEKFSHEIFSIINRFVKERIPLYELKSWLNEKISGTFYESELQKVYVNQNTVYKIDKIIKKQKKNNINGVVVSWLGWPKAYNSWISNDQLTDIYKT